MALPLSISILRRKRDRIRDVIAAYEAKLREAQADLAHVNATLRLFEATGSPEDFPAYIDLNRVFRRGETTSLCLAALRLEGPQDTRQLPGTGTGGLHPSNGSMAGCATPASSAGHTAIA